MEIKLISFTFLVLLSLFSEESAGSNEKDGDEVDTLIKRLENILMTQRIEDIALADLKDENLETASRKTLQKRWLWGGGVRGGSSTKRVRTNDIRRFRKG